MSTVDYIKQLSAARNDPRESPLRQSLNALKDLDEVERTLREIGADLEPNFFNVSLWARIGAKGPAR